MAQSGKESIVDQVLHALEQIEGAFSLCLLSDEYL